MPRRMEMWSGVPWVSVATAVSVAREGSGTGAFKVDAGEVVESEADGSFECLGGEQRALGGILEGEF